MGEASGLSATRPFLMDREMERFTRWRTERVEDAVGAVVERVRSLFWDGGMEMTNGGRGRFFAASRIGEEGGEEGDGVAMTSGWVLEKEGRCIDFVRVRWTGKECLLTDLLSSAGKERRCCWSMSAGATMMIERVAKRIYYLQGCCWARVNKQNENG